MTFDLKTLSPDAVPRALAKAERYRLLNEPGEAESICRDALQVDPDNQDALVMLLLALTEQFQEETTAVADACDCAERIRNDYDRAYYAGIILERRAKAQLHRAVPNGGPRVYEWLRTRGPRRSARPAMTTRCCDGTRARVSSCAIIGWCPRRKNGPSRCCSNRRRAALKGPPYDRPLVARAFQARVRIRISAASRVATAVPAGQPAAGRVTIRTPDSVTARRCCSSR